MRKRSVTIRGHATSISLEDDFWRELQRMAGEAGISTAALVAGIDAERQEKNLSSAVRLAVLADLRSKALRAGETPALSG
jgi:predicted DNA-binding ribbon-helix-helix protein